MWPQIGASVTRVSIPRIRGFGLILGVKDVFNFASMLADICDVLYLDTRVQAVASSCLAVKALRRKCVADFQAHVIVVSHRCDEE